MISMAHPEQEPQEADFPAQGPPGAQLRFLLGYAVLAPSTHNTQPWQFALHDDAVELYADYRRVLPGIDAQGRELVISCGAALFYLRSAGAAPARLRAGRAPDPAPPGRDGST